LLRLHNRDDHNAAEGNGTACGNWQLINNIHKFDTHRRLAASSVLKDFLKEEETKQNLPTLLGGSREIRGQKQG